MRRIGSGWVGLFLLLLIGTTSSAQVQRTGRWTLQNGVVRKTISVTKERGLETTEWSDLSTGYNFISPEYTQGGCNEFQVKVDDKTVSGQAADVDLTSARQYEAADGSSLLDLTFTAKHAQVRVTVHYELGRGQPAIRQWLSIENMGSAAITLRNLTVACGRPAPGPERDLIAYGGYGEQPRETYFTGRVNDVLVMLENAKTGIGWAVLSEVPGYMKRTEVGQLGQWSPSFAAMYDTDLFAFERTLAPKETFTTAGASVLLYKRGTAADPHWRIPEYVRDRIAHNKQIAAPLWIYNTWEPWHNNVRAADLVGVDTKAAADGFNIFAIDDGWEAKFGENVVDPVHFPEGLEPVFAHADTLGLKRGLWSTVAIINMTTPTYLKHPEWACISRDGKPYMSNGEGVVMCLASPYKYEVIERMSDLVRRYKLTYLKLDLTTVFNTYSEEPGCYEGGHEHGSSRESAGRIYEALNLIADTLHQRFPGLLIDYTFELWGEKHLIDYGLLRVADLDWLSNVPDRSKDEAGTRQVRTLLYQRGMAIPVESLLIGNLQAEMGSWQEHVATEMGAGPVFLGNLNKQSDVVSQHYKEWIARYTKLRSEVALTDSFFPLGAWRQPRVDEWDGYARVARTGEGLVALFRNESRVESAKVTIPGFPDGRFVVRSFVARSWESTDVLHVEGKALREGLVIPFAVGENVTVLEIRASHGTHGKP